MEDKSAYREPDGETARGNTSESESWESSESETEESSDDVEWDGSESELILEDDNEEYEEDMTGIKLKYVLSEKEISEIFKHTEGYRKNCKLQKNHTIIQSVVFVVLLVLWLALGNTYYALLAALPILCIAIIWIIPIFSIKRLARDFFSGEEISTEIYPDKICMEIKDRGKEREILLDGTAEYEELAGEILIYPKNSDTLIIPMRAIEPEFLPDVQAMLVAGTKPKDDE